MIVFGTEILSVARIDAAHAHGAPRVRFLDGVRLVASDRGGLRVKLSLADEMDYVVAFAILAK